MIDLHLHILPALDDGPIDLAASVALARAVVADGVSIVAATPHVRHDHPRVTGAAIADRVAAIREAFRAEGIALQVVAAGELDAAVALGLDGASLRALTYGGNGHDLLLEAPSGHDTSAFDEAIDRLTAFGFRVIAAHPERCRRFQREPKLLGELTERGVLLQLTASALVELASTASLTARRALKEGWVHLLASDAHSLAWRPPMLGAAATAVERLLPRGGAEARWLTQEAPAAVLAGTPLPPRPTRPGSLRRWAQLTGRS